MMRYRYKSYAPAHITGFFEICEHSDPKLTGSRGAGIVLEHGCVTEAEISEGNRVEINGMLEKAPTTRLVMESLAKRPVFIKSNFDLPIGCGFGLSGAGAVSTALSLGELFGLNMTVNELAGFAHEAEVMNRTGLGDVIAQVHGGLVIRKEPGAPGIGVIDRVSVASMKVGIVVFGEKSTQPVLEDADMKRRINKAGKSALKSLLKKPTLPNFMDLSKEFALGTELISEKARDAIEAVEASGGLVAVAMLGDSVFAIGGFDVLAEFGELRISRIQHGRARLI